MIPFQTTNLNVTGLDVSAPDEADLNAGADPYVEITLSCSMGLQTPQGTAMIPAAIYHYNLDRDTAEKVGQKLIDLAKGLPAPSKLQTASSLSQVQAEADRLAKLKG